MSVLVYHPWVAIFEQLDNLIISVIWRNPLIQSLTQRGRGFVNVCFHSFILSPPVNECCAFFWQKIFIIRCHSTQRLLEPHHWDDKSMGLGDQWDSSSVYWIPTKWDRMQDKCSCSPNLHFIVCFEERVAWIMDKWYSDSICRSQRANQTRDDFIRQVWLSWSGDTVFSLGYMEFSTSHLFEQIVPPSGQLWLYLSPKPILVRVLLLQGKF